ncbi:MAG: FAD-dependent oxidoreductase, partial [Deltaproteobacteria bacterium]|nr:FAD-dependent oxidoreductase [Deltaproteobacteria bacterium]
MLCACEDVTLSEVRRAFARGHRDLESVKRYTGFGTGPCQGKSCQNAVVQELLRLGATPAQIAPFTSRPPVQPVTFGTLAALDPSTLPLGEGVPLPVDPPPLPPASSGPLPDRAEVVIIGGGILGLSLAYELGRRGVRDVVVLERSYLNSGASGRNGGGVRAQWSTPTMIRLGLRSLQAFSRFAGETGVNVWFRRGGYLFLAPDAAQVKRLERNL